MGVPPQKEAPPPYVFTPASGDFLFGFLIAAPGRLPSAGKFALVAKVAVPWPYGHRAVRTAPVVKRMPGAVVVGAHRCSF